MTKVIRRYNSTIYGNYRLAGLKYGSIIGGVIGLLVLLYRLLSPEHYLTTPENYITDGVMLAGILLTTYMYRESLPEKKSTLNELLRMGLWTGVIASVVYGLLLWLWCGVMFPDMVETYVEQRIAVMPKAESSAEAKVAVELVKNYGAGDWAFIGAFRNGVMSIIMVFVAALIFRNENAPVRKKENKNDNEENSSKD